MQRNGLMRSCFAVLVGTAMAASLGVLGAGSAAGHGYTDSPASRQLHCAEGTVDNCGPIQWEPQSVEGPDGFPAEGPPDGQICAGGNERFAPLDNPRGGEWPAEDLVAGTAHEFQWTLTAQHSTATFEYFVTTDNYNPREPLTRDMLEPEPFAAVQFHGERPPRTFSHTSQLPRGKQGRHLILGVWTVADTPNAFYACHDVVFTDSGSDPAPEPDPGQPGCDAPPWTPDATYVEGDTVSHDGATYRAKWWTRGTEPGTSGPWGVWERVHTCT